MRPRPTFPSPAFSTPVRLAPALAGRLALALLAAPLAAALPAAPARADVPFPTCEEAECDDPADFADYLFLPPDRLPDDFDPAAGSSWKYNPGSGVDVPAAWRITTGRPDVVTAVLDSGIRWHEREVSRKVALNTGELPPPPGCAVHDCNGDGFVSVDDYAAVPDANGNGHIDGQDLIVAYSDGVDDDGNGYVDDIAGWDFLQDDNDPYDDTDYGHGTGEAEDSTGEADNGSGLPGVAPSSMFLPLRVGDSFIAIGSDFAQAVVYAVDREVAVVQEALGTISASATSQGAIDYAYRRGIPVVASAADEESRHHNMPASLDHTLWVNSVVHGDGTIVQEEDVYDLVNGCTNFGGHAWVAIPSNGCSSEATGRASGLALLLVSHGRNLMDRGLLEPYPGLDTPFSAEEIRQLFRRSARDVDHSDDLEDLTIFPLLGDVLSGMLPEFAFGSRRFPTQSDWDAYTGYGRPDAPALLDVTAETLPPEADLTSDLAWFDIVDPVATPSLPVHGSAAAVRGGNVFDWRLEVGCGVQPQSWTELGSGSESSALEDAALGTWDAGATAAACGFDPAVPIEDPEAHTVTLRLQVVDANDNLGEDRRTVAIHRDETLKAHLDLGASAEGSAALADVDRDGVLDVVLGTTDGRVHALRGGSEPLPGFPARTDPLPVHDSPAWSGEVEVPHEALIAPTASDDLDGDGRVEIVVASVEGGVYVFDDHGTPRPGFPVRTDPALSAPENRDPLNDTDPGITAAPTLVDLDPPGVHPALEIVVPSWDGHVYAWRADGTPVAGWPVRVADRSKVALDPATGKATPIASGVRERAAKILGSTAVGDLDGDGRAEVLVASNEEYSGEPDGFALETPLTTLFAQLGSQLGGFTLDVRGRLYALRPDGDAAPGGPILPGWPAGVPLVAAGLLPTVGTGVPGAAALADVDGSGELAAAISGVAGPAMLFGPDGAPRLGDVGGVPRAFAADFPNGFPDVPATAGSGDAPFFPALGSGAFGDLNGDGSPEYVAPTAGVRKLVDIGGPGWQTYSDHQVSAWDPTDGSLLPAFPRLMDDTQFLSTPALADVDGDGQAEAVQGSGVYLLRAYRADGSTPADFPKFTHGWILASPSAGDLDGDGLVEVVAHTREGRLFVWDTPAPATEAALPWPGFGRDRRNTQNLASGVSSLAAPVAPSNGLVWALEALRLELVGEPATPPSLLPAIDRALARLARGRMVGLLGPLTQIAQGLSTAGLAEASDRFGTAVRQAAAATLEATDCGGDATCQALASQADAWLQLADLLDGAYGGPGNAFSVTLRARVLTFLANAG